MSDSIHVAAAETLRAVIDGFITLVTLAAMVTMPVITTVFSGFLAENFVDTAGFDRWHEALRSDLIFPNARGK
jgi:hypothetical protein